MEKVTLTDEDRTAYQLTLQDDYSRAYVFCDLFREVNLETTVRALIAAMRRYRTIPKAVVFDNGSFFKGKLLREFCRNLGVRLIHSSVRHRKPTASWNAHSVMTCASSINKNRNELRSAIRAA